MGGHKGTPHEHNPPHSESKSIPQCPRALGSCAELATREPNNLMIPRRLLESGSRRARGPNTGWSQSVLLWRGRVTAGRFSPSPDSEEGRDSRRRSSMAASLTRLRCASRSLACVPPQLEPGLSAHHLALHRGLFLPGIWPGAPLQTVRVAEERPGGERLCAACSFGFSPCVSFTPQLLI